MRGCVHAFRRAPSCTAGRAVIRPAAVLPFAGTLVRMQIRTQVQGNPVVDEVSALVAVIRPILNGLLWGLKSEVAAQVGGPENVKLMMLARLVRPGDGDLGICFEYAVHNALRAGEQAVVERVDDALSRLCGVSGNQLDSILFAAEKTGSEQLISRSARQATQACRGDCASTSQTNCSQGVAFKYCGRLEGRSLSRQDRFRPMGSNDGQVQPVRPRGRSWTSHRDRACQ